MGRNRISKNELNDNLQLDLQNMKEHENEIATVDKLGHVKPDGVTITIDDNGTIKGANTYTLPAASASTLGGVKIGTGLSISVDGTLSSSSNVVQDASINQKGIVQLNNSIDSNSQTLSATPYAVKQVNDKVDLKANKVQQSWQTAVLQTGWTHDSSNNLRYYKDEFNVVHVQGGVNKGSGASSIIAYLPVGYRVLNSSYLACSGNSSGSQLTAQLVLQTDGIIATSTSLTYIFVDASFRVS